MTKLQMLLRSAMAASVLMAGSCAAPMNDGKSLMADGIANHPIAIEPGMQSLRVSYAPNQGMSAGDASKLDMFLADYRLHGSGSISISAPPGQASRPAIGWFAERIAASGVSRDKILVATRENPGDFKVELSYITYRAFTRPCGDWSENLANNASNLPPKNFGCSIQQNVAAMIADPRDLQEPRAVEGANANRRSIIVGNYEQGKVTSAEKRKGDLGNEQAGTSSGVGR